MDPLCSNQIGIHTVLDIQQCIVTPLLHYDTLFHHHNVVGILDGAKTMSHGDSRASMSRAIQCFLHDAFTRRVKRACSLVKKQNARILHDSSRYRNTLLLTTTQQSRTLANKSMIALGQLHNKVMRICKFGSVLDEFVLFFLRPVFVRCMQ